MSLVLMLIIIIFGFAEIYGGHSLEKFNKSKKKSVPQFDAIFFPYQIVHLYIYALLKNIQKSVPRIKQKLAMALENKFEIYSKQYDQTNGSFAFENL